MVYRCNILSAMTTTPALQQVKLEKEEDEMVGTSSTINHGHSQLESFRTRDG